MSTFGTRNGRTKPTQGAGSAATIPLGPCGGPGRQSPGSEPGTNVKDPPRPSFCLAISIAEAAASPTAIPPVFAAPSGRLASDVSYSACSAASCDDGTTPASGGVRCGKPTNTRNAAVAAAASIESFGLADGLTR